MTNFFFFRREKLATQITDALIGGGLVDAGSGLFLAAPRRVGKSTFLREDLVPELESRGVLPVYVDLWADKKVDPAKLINDSIKRALHENDGFLAKAARAAGLKKLGIGAVSFDIDRIGEVDGITLTDALTTLCNRAGKPVALLVDEAQHALTTSDGQNAMFALKAARDSLNQQSGARRLLLVFTGSHRDKLAHLILKRDQSFYGAQMMDFPLLGRDYSDAYTDWVNARLAADNQVDKDDMFKAFDLIGRRPEMLSKIITKIALEMEVPGGLKKEIADGAALIMDRVWSDFDREFSALTLMQGAVLIRLIQSDDGFNPFAEESLQAYSRDTGTSVDATSVQAALKGLREKNIIWKSSRGTYTLDDQSMEQWYAHKSRQTKIATEELPPIAYDVFPEDGDSDNRPRFDPMS